MTHELLQRRWRQSAQCKLEAVVMAESVNQSVGTRHSRKEFGFRHIPDANQAILADRDGVLEPSRSTLYSTTLDAPVLDSMAQMSSDIPYNRYVCIQRA